jgi:hypothetical protein
MRNDLSIAQDSHRYRFGVIWAAVFIFVYPIGVPLLYLYVLYANRTAIKSTRNHADHVDRADLQGLMTPSALSSIDPVQSSRSIGHRLKSFLSRGHEKVKHYITPNSISFLYDAYEGQFWYWEVVETLRRILLTAVISVVSPGNIPEYVMDILRHVLIVSLH